MFTTGGEWHLAQSENMARRFAFLTVRFLLFSSKQYIINQLPQTIEACKLNYDIHMTQICFLNPNIFQENAGTVAKNARS